MHTRTTDRYLLIFLVLSLLLHGLLVLVSHEPPKPAPVEPVSVEMYDVKPVPEMTPNQAPEQPREEPAKRTGDADRVAPVEQAPKGDAPDDKGPPPAAATPDSAEPPREKMPLPIRLPSIPESPSSEALPRPELGEEKPPLSLKDLLKVPETTATRVTEEAIRQKYRNDVEEGKAVWLDTRNDILFSFFKRFKDNIYLVWNYPAESAMRREEGTCLLKITITRAGTASDVQLMESSGYDRLDQQAISAVRKGSPFGPLPSAYAEDSLTIFAFFHYNLSGQIIY